MSVLLRPTVGHAPLIPLVMGLAAVDAVQHLAGESVVPPVGLKWPNDVLAPTLGERKVAGILAESTTVAPSTSAGAGTDPARLTVVVGMGMNLRWSTPPPADVAERAATLTEVLGRSVDRNEVLTVVLASLETRLVSLEDAGSRPVLAAYRDRCLTIGRRVRFETSGGEHTGTVADVTEDGLLVLRTDGGATVELNAGDAHHLPTLEA